MTTAQRDLIPVRRLVMIVAGVLSAIAVAVVTIVSVRHSSDDLNAGSFEQQDADRIAADVASGDPQRIRDAIGVPDDQSLDPATIEQLSHLQLFMDASTFSTDAEGVTTVTGTITDVTGATTSAMFYLVQVEGVWVVFDVVPR